jgi:hypothetical protein
MFVRHAISIVLLLVLFGSPARAEQEPSFVLTVGKASAKTKRPLNLEPFEDAVRARERVLKPALLARTKPNPSSRLTIKAEVSVVGKGLVRATVVDVSYRNASGPITDDSIKTIVEDAFLATPQQPKTIGAKVDVSIRVLQP